MATSYLVVHIWGGPSVNHKKLAEYPCGVYKRTPRSKVQSMTRAGQWCRKHSTRGGTNADARRGAKNRKPVARSGSDPARAESGLGYAIALGPGRTARAMDNLAVSDAYQSHSPGAFE